MKVLLLRAKGEIVRKNLHVRSIRIPYFLKYIEAGLKHNDINTLFYDEYMENTGFLFYYDNYDWVITSIITSDFKRTYNILKKIKHNNPHTKVIAIGQDPTSRPDFYKNKEYIDFLGIGECELSIINFFKNGIIDRRCLFEREKAFLKKPYTIDNLDDLPIIQYSDKELNSYNFFYPLKVDFKVKYGHILTSRGCVYNCKFCSQVLRESFGTNMRYHSVDRIIKEIEILLSKGVNFLIFDDDNFGFNLEWLKELFTKWNQKHGEFPPWQCHLRIESMSDEALKLFSKNNCKLLRVGVESGSFKVLKLMGKTNNPELFLKRAYRAFKIAKKLNIPTLFLCMIGNVKEDLRDIWYTFKFIRKLDPELLQVSFFTVYPGSFFYSEGKKMDNTPYHYALPEKRHSNIYPIVLKMVQFFLYVSFYFRPIFILKHFFRYGKFYYYNRYNFFKLLKNIVYLFTK